MSAPQGLTHPFKDFFFFFFFFLSLFVAVLQCDGCN